MKYLHTLLLSLLISYSVVGQGWDSIGDNTTVGSLKLGEYTNLTSDAEYKLHSIGGGILVEDDLQPTLTLSLLSDSYVKQAWLDISIAGGNKYYSRLAEKEDVVFRAGTSGSMLFSNEGGGPIKFGIGAWDLHYLAMILSEEGNLGIGLTEPEAILHAKASNPSIILQDSDSNSFATTNTSIKFNNGYATVGQIVQAGENLSIESTGSVSSLSFKTKEIERMRLTSDGNVGIGTSNPEEKLHIKGNLYVDSGVNDNKIY